MELRVGGIVATCPHCKGSRFRPAPEAGDSSRCTVCGNTIDLTALLAHVGFQRIANEAQALGGTSPEDRRVGHVLFLPKADLGRT
jgi:hypothetical protein